MENNKFVLNIVNENAKDLQQAYGVADERLQHLQGKVNAAFDAQKENPALDTGLVLQQVVPDCECLEEVVMVSYAVGAVFQKRQSRNPLAELAALAALIG